MSGFDGLFGNDFFIAVSTAAVQRNLGRLLHLLGACGFEVPMSEFQDNSESMELLGVQIIRRLNHVEINCDSREEQILALMDILRERVTKQKAFALAGLLGYDALGGHAERRLIADVIRSLVGKYIRPKKWTEELILNPEDLKVFSELLGWSSAILREPCRHRTLPSANSPPSRNRREQVWSRICDQTLGGRRPMGNCLRGRVNMEQDPSLPPCE
jgi:hypothetical protein